MSPPPTHTAPLFLTAAAVCGAVLGLVSGLGGASLFVLGLWPLAAALGAGFTLVATAHLLAERRSWVHLAAAGVVALTWISADRVADAALFHAKQTTQVGRQGLLLADHAVVHDDDDPGALVDASLLAETGASGWLGAARVQLRVGVPALRVLSVSRVFKVPMWAHALWLALRTALVALIAARALEQLRAEPTCATCGRSLRRRRLGWLSEAQAEALAASWAQRPEDPAAPATSADAHADRPLATQGGDRERADSEQLPALAAQRDTGWPVAVLQDVCPRGHTLRPGLELQRARGRGLARRAPGPLARREATTKRCGTRDDERGRDDRDGADTAELGER